MKQSDNSDWACLMFAAAALLICTIAMFTSVKKEHVGEVEAVEQYVITDFEMGDVTDNFFLITTPEKPESEYVGTPIQDADGTVIGNIYAIAGDCTYICTYAE